MSRSHMDPGGLLLVLFLCCSGACAQNTENAQTAQRDDAAYQLLQRQREEKQRRSSQGEGQAGPHLDTNTCGPLTVSCLWYVWTAHCVLSVYVWTAHCVLSVVRVEPLTVLSLADCSLTDKHRADVVLVLDGFNNITSEDFSKVTRFLETLVQNLGVVGLDLVRFALVKCGVKPEIEFYLNTYNDVSSVVSAVKNLSQSPASPGDLTCNIAELRKTILSTDGDRIEAPDALIVISDRNTPDINKDTVTVLWTVSVKVLIVAVKEADYSEINDIKNNLGKPEVFNAQTLTVFQTF
ncbi:hypothetical protein WMY93_004871 [Mugilogobius chulae]|uniref:VWFA domain-containing protein n=1 Tax=Mugilogobius chulae TaxID=88201 RepID=A0AAW0PVS5_9GOBI